MSDSLTSSDIVAIEQQLNEVDPLLTGDPAMLVAMAIRLDETDEQQNAVRQSIAQYVAFRWPNLRRDLMRSLTAGALKGLLLRDAKQRRTASAKTRATLN